MNELTELESDFLDTWGAALASQNYWDPRTDMWFPEWEAAVTQAWKLYSNMPWILGDMLLWGRHWFGEDYAQAIPTGTRANESLRVYLWVSERFSKIGETGRPEPRGRREELTHTHHKIVAAMPHELQDAWLTQAVNHQWSTRELEEEIAKFGQNDDQQQPGQGDQGGSGDDVVTRVTWALRDVLQTYVDSPDDIEEIIREVIKRIE